MANKRRNARWASLVASAGLTASLLTLGAGSANANTIAVDPFLHTAVTKTPNIDLAVTADGTGLRGIKPPQEKGVTYNNAAYGSTLRVFTSVTVPDGNLTNDLLAGGGWGRTLSANITDKSTVGSWSNNILKPNPQTGDSTVAIAATKDGTLDVGAWRKVRIRATKFVPTFFTTWKIDGVPRLAINYRVDYARQTCTYGKVAGVLIANPGVCPDLDDNWEDVSLEEVGKMYNLGQGVRVPQP